MGTTSSRLLGYVELTKPRLLFLLFFTALVEALAQHGLAQPSTLAILLLSVLLTVGGTNALTCYLDRDIDSVMERTRQRPLPKGVIEDRQALRFGSILLIAGLAATLLINPYVTLWGVAGSALVLVYNWKLKRSTPWNVLIASPGGAAPVLGAYSAMTGELLSLESILLAPLIVLWTPVHIWSLAIFYSNDYRRAGVPMLPAVERSSRVKKLIVLFTLLYLLDALLLFLTRASLVAVVIFTMLSYPLLRHCIRAYRSSAPALQLSLFRATNTHLACVLIAYLLLSSL